MQLQQRQMRKDDLEINNDENDIENDHQDDVKHGMSNKNETTFNVCNVHCIYVKRVPEYKF